MHSVFRCIIYLFFSFFCSWYNTMYLLVMNGSIPTSSSEKREEEREEEEEDNISHLHFVISSSSSYSPVKNSNFFDIANFFNKKNDLMMMMGIGEEEKLFYWYKKYLSKNEWKKRMEKLWTIESSWIVNCLCFCSVFSFNYSQKYFIVLCKPFVQNHPGSAGCPPQYVLWGRSRRT